MAMAIIPRIGRGRLYFQTVDVLFPSFAAAASAWRAVEAHRRKSRCPAFVAKDGAQ